MFTGGKGEALRLRVSQGRGGEGRGGDSGEVLARWGSYCPASLLRVFVPLHCETRGMGTGAEGEPCGGQVMQVRITGMGERGG